MPCLQLDTNLMPKRGSTLHHYQRQAFPEPYGYRAETHIEISAGVPTGGRIRQVTKTVSQGKLRVKKRKAPQTPFRVMGRSRNSPPPKTAPSQANRIRGHEEWLQRATGRWTGHHDGRSVFIGCPPDVGLVPQNHPLCRSDAEIGTFIACETRNQCRWGSHGERTPGEGADDGRNDISHSSARFYGTVRTR